MRFALIAGIAFYGLLLAALGDYLISAIICSCWTPGQPPIWPRVALYYAIAILAALLAVWPNDGED